LNDILDISKVEAGKLILEDISFNLRGTVEDVANLLSQNAYAKNIDLLIDIDPSFPEKMFGDPTRIRQIINNLAGNAIKFTETGYVLLSLHVEHSDTIIRVRDTGIGINKDDVDKIFAPFSQAYSDTTRKFGGTGLGLTLCRQLITEMGGILEVESEEKVGSAFTARLPLRQDATSAPFQLEPELLKISVILVQRQPLQYIPIIYKQLQYWGISTELLKYHELKHIQWPVDRVKESSIIILDDAELISILPDTVNQNRVVLLSHKPPASSRLHSVSPPLNRTLLHQVLCRAINKEKSGNAEPDIETPNRDINEISVLLVEDNKVNQMVAKTILKKIGYNVSLAANGEEAIKLIQGKSFDVVLMDCHMPVMDGYEATKVIRNNLRMSNLPIIAVTANVMHGDKEKCFQSGMDDYISKPYKKSALLQIIKKWVKA